METDTPYREVPPRPNAIRLELTYDGPEVAAGTMDAYALGLAMQSLAEYIDASASLLYGAGTTVTHEVEAEFKQGSFTLFLTSLTPDQAEAAGNLLHYLTSKEFYGILGLTGGGGIFGLVRFLRGQKPAAVSTMPGTQQATVTNGSGQTTIVNAHTVNLYNNTTVRETVGGLVAPLEREGITSFRAGEAGRPQETVVTQADIEYFEPPPVTGEQLLTQETTEIVTVANFSFDQGKKWRFRLADGTSFMSPLDDDFARKVARREVLFGAGDALEIRVHTVVTRDEAGHLHTQRTLVKVVKRIPPQKLQLDLGTQLVGGVAFEAELVDLLDDAMTRDVKRLPRLRPGDKRRDEEE